MAVVTGVKVIVDKTQNIIKALDALSNQQVLVGIPEDKTARKDEETGVTNAELGYIHELGAPEANIPARPFLIPGVKRVFKQITDILRAAAVDALEGRVSKVEGRLRAAGFIASGSVKAVLNEGVPPPLSERTLAARRRDGFKGTKPLIRTAQLRNSITFVIRRLKTKVLSAFY